MKSRGSGDLVDRPRTPVPEARVVYRHATAPETATFNSGDLNTVASTYLLSLTNVTAISGAGASLTVVMQSKDEAGNYFNHVTGTPISSASQQIANIGPGCTSNLVIGRISRLNFVIAGTTPSVTFEATLYADV